MEEDQRETGDDLDAASEDREGTSDGENLQIAQLQGLVAELREGLHAALTELCELRQRDQGLEEKLGAHQTEVDDKIMGLKNSLNTFKEELSVALFHIKDVSGRQREVIRRIEQLQSEPAREVVPAQHRKTSKADALAASGDEHICSPGQASDLSVIQNYFSSLPQAESPQRSNTSTQTSTSDKEQQRGCPSKPPVWTERKSSRDETETPGAPAENNKRQKAALELLESERVYVSHLSLLLKANISFNGSEALTAKDKRPFPSSLRFLIQQHLELLHTLQERVLKCQWQGIMGDIFMRLTSKESDFLDFYVSYLKELPDCLAVVTMLASTMKTSPFLELDIVGDESNRLSLSTLLLQPVQRIPEYMLLLQGLLRQTDADHPDYYLLLVCIQQFRTFSTQYHHLLQHNQELLLHNRKELRRSTMKQLLRTDGGIPTNNLGSPYPHGGGGGGAMLEHANQVKRSKQRLLEQIQSHRYQDWDRDQEQDGCYGTEWQPQFPFFGPDLDSRNHKAAGLRAQKGLSSIPESEASERSVSCQHHPSARPADFHQGQPGSALADALGEFLLPPDPPGMESMYEEDRSSLHDISMFDRCSTASSDSSIDIAFVKCPKAPMAPHHALVTNVSTSCDIFSNGGHGNGYGKLPNRGCASPDEAVLMRRNQHRPLQVTQRKSKSLNGLQMDSTVSGLDGGHLSEQRAGLGSHTKLERQGSRGSRGCVTPSRKLHSPLGNRADGDKQADELHGLLGMDPGMQPWGEESKWRGGTEDNNHSAFSERSRKDKGGFRSSFKKLFKKKGGDDKKDKGGEKTQDAQNNGDHDAAKTPKLVHLELNRGTAV